MDNALDVELRHCAEMAAKFCEPQLHVIGFSYAPPTGWRCIIQESRFVPVSIGIGAEPSAAFNTALRDLITRRNNEINENQG